MSAKQHLIEILFPEGGPIREYARRTMPNRFVDAFCASQRQTIPPEAKEFAARARAELADNPHLADPMPARKHDDRDDLVMYSTYDPVDDEPPVGSEAPDYRQH